MQPVLFCIHLNGMGVSSPQHISLAQLIDFHTNANNTHTSNRRQKLVGYMYRYRFPTRLTCSLVGLPNLPDTGSRYN